VLHLWLPARDPAACLYAPLVLATLVTSAALPRLVAAALPFHHQRPRNTVASVSLP
jgi:hypothetical protein